MPGGTDVDLKTCKSCDTLKNVKFFPLSNRGKYRASVCRQCKDATRRAVGRCRLCVRSSVPGKTHCTYHLEYLKSRRLDVRTKVISYYCGGEIRCQCAGCPEKDIRFLTIDHLFGGGGAHRRQLTGKSDNSGVDIYRWLYKHGYPSGFAVLCYNCNCAKGVYGNCPHQPDIISIVRKTCEVKDGEIVLKDGATECHIVRQNI